MKSQRMHPAIIALTCFVAAQPSLDGKLLSELLRKMIRSSKLTPTEKRHLRNLARSVDEVHRSTQKILLAANDADL